MSRYNVLYNNTAMIILPATESLSDIALDKGWRILHADLSLWDTKKYTEQFNCEMMDGSQFYLDYLAEELLDEQDIEYISALSDPLWENTMVAPDADEEEFDESFSSVDEDQEETEEA
jgi:hypothetical protein